MVWDAFLLLFCYLILSYYTLFIVGTDAASIEDSISPYIKIIMKFFFTLIYVLGIIVAINAADHSTGNICLMFMIAAVLLLVLAAANIFYHSNNKI